MKARTIAAPQAVTLYHSTTTENATEILTTGFRDAIGHYLTDREWNGVWLSDVPLDENEGPRGSTVLEVALNLTEEELTSYEWTCDGQPYREWLVPAALINPRMTVRVLDGEALEEAGTRRWKATTKDAAPPSARAT